MNFVKFGAGDALILRGRKWNYIYACFTFWM